MGNIYLDERLLAQEYRGQETGDVPQSTTTSGTVSLNPPSIAAQSRGSVTFTITGAAVGDVVVMQPPGALNAGLVYAGCAVTAPNTVTVYLGNLTGGAIDDGAQTWRWLLVDLT